MEMSSLLVRSIDECVKLRTSPAVPCYEIDHNIMSESGSTTAHMSTTGRKTEWFTFHGKQILHSPLIRWFFHIEVAKMQRSKPVSY